MEPQERQRLISVIESLASTINHSRQRAEESRIRLQNKHMAAEDQEREALIGGVEAEIENL